MRTLALDKASVRTMDVDGRLHVSLNNISKASVDPYYGREIPGGEELGLAPDRIYYLLRHPDELAKAAPTFNNLPILAEHVPVSADDHQPDLVIGSTGTDAVFNDPYLQNSAVIWARDAIEDINSEEKRDWSCGYRYSADMTPGRYKGLRYDGVMRDIVGNHLALVEQGRAGPDVVVGDSRFKGGVMLKSRRALLLQGAFSAAIGPKLAAGAKVDFAGALDGVTVKNIDKRKSALAASIVKLAKPKLAADEGLDVSDVVEIIEAVQGMSDADDPAEDDDLNAPAMDEEKCPTCGKLKTADDAEPGMKPGMKDDKKDDKDKPAMDAAAVRAAALRDMRELRIAEDAVAPFIGKIAMDAAASAADVYKLALDAAEVDLTGVHPSAFKAMVAMLPAPDAAAPPVRLALDAGNAMSDFKAMFPHAAKLARG